MGVEVFEGDWGEEAEGGVTADRIIEGFDVVEDHGFCLRAGGGDLVLEAFGFEGGPEGFCGGVIVAVGAAAHALGDAQVLEGAAEEIAGILGALVTVVDEAGEPTRGLGGGALKCFEHQRCFHVIGGGPADHPTAVEVDFGGEKKPSFLSGNVGDIGNPDLVWSGGSGSIEQTLGSGSPCTGAIGSPWHKAALLYGAKSLLAHEPGDAAPAAAVTAIAQFVTEAWRPVGVAALFEGRAHFF